MIKSFHRDIILAKKISQIKAECKRRIIEVEGFTIIKQINATQFVARKHGKKLIDNEDATTSEKNKMRNFKNDYIKKEKYRTKSNENEAALDVLTDDQLKAYDVTDDTHWVLPE